MNCPKCNQSYKDPLATFSIVKTGLCPVCYKKRCDAIAEEEAKNTYEVEIRFSDTVTVKAMNEDDAAEIALEQVDYYGADTYVRKTKDGVPAPEVEDPGQFPEGRII